MKPVDQTIFGDGKGNCFAACVASILELPIEEVPNFCEGWDEEWFDKYQEWLRPHGFSVVMLVAWSEWKPNPGQLCTMGGKSPRGDFDHCVVGEWTGEEWRVVHDPHPSRAGLDGKAKRVEFLIPLDPVHNLLLSNHLPLQPLEWVDDVIRFRENRIVRFLLDQGPFDMNKIALLDGITREEREQFAQLIGYSVSGFGDLSYVSDETYNAADMACDRMVEARDRNTKGD